MQGKIVAEIGGLIGTESASAIQTMIEKARTPATGVFATIVSVITLLLGATGEVSWHDVWIGAGMTALLFVISKFLLGLYLGRSSIGSAYGPTDSLVFILAWVYYSSLVLLFGAEFTEVYAHRYGSRATSTAASPLPQPHDRTTPVVPQGMRSVPSPDYGRYVTATLSFVAGMIIGARRRAVSLTSLVSVLHKCMGRKDAYATVRGQDAEAMVTPGRGTT